MTHDLHHLAGAYALDALDADERILFESWLQTTDEATGQEVCELVATAAVLAEDAAEQPPAGLRDSVLAMCNETRQLPPVVTSLEDARARRRESRRPSWIAGVAAGAAAVLLTAGASLTLFERIDTLEANVAVANGSLDVVSAPDAQFISADQADGSSARVVYSESRGEGVFLASGLAELGDDQVYALWLIRGEAAQLTSIFSSADGQTAQAISGSLNGVTAVGVTIEPKGAVITQPSTAPVVVVGL